MQILNARNPKYTERGMIELEIEHPQYGWIPFAASPDDVEVHGRDLYASAVAGEFGVVAPYVKPLAQAQSERITIIESAYATEKESPITYAGHVFQANTGSFELMTQVASALPTGAGIGWYDIDNIEVSLTDVQFAELRGAILMRGQPLFAKRRQLKDAIRAAATVAEVEKVVW